MNHRPAQVLVVDPDNGVSAVVGSALPKNGAYHVDIATSADQAQEKIDRAASDYDVVLISETLPQHPGSTPTPLGLKLVEKFKVRSPVTEILFLATNGHGSALAALRAGAFHCLEKPLRDPAEVAIFIERAVQLHDLKEVAATALVDAELLTERTEKLTRIEKLSHATQQIMADLANAPLEDRLTAIARHATQILDAETGGVFIVKKKGVLTLIASHGHKRGGFLKGREVEIREGEKTGLTGFIASAGKLFNVHGEALTQHKAVRGTTTHRPSGECHSLLAIPLFRRQRVPGADPVEDIVGLLRVDNKLGDDGQPRPELRFTSEDEWVLEFFAEVVVVAIESAELVDRLKEETDYKDRLINSSPNGIITNDTHGTVIEFNAKAESILGYKAREARGETVQHLYLDPSTPNTIGAELEKGGGLVTDYHTLLKHRDGDSIPIKISAIWLYDARGERIGTAGFFEDLRALQ